MGYVRRKPCEARPWSIVYESERSFTVKSEEPGQSSAVAPVLSDARTVGYADALAWFELRKPTYLRLVRAIAPFVDRDGTILDVGANMGYFTKTLGEELGFRGNAHLFEPVPNLAQLCRETVLTLPFKTEVHEFGLSDEDGSFDIFVAADGNLGWNTMIAEKSHGMAAVKIAVRSFDNAGIAEVPTFVKIDVEGAESKVLRGMLGALERWPSRPTILCEIGWGQDHPQWQQELDVFRALQGIGYTALDLSHNPVEIESLVKTTDLIFVSDEIANSIRVKKEASGEPTPAAAARGALAVAQPSRVAKFSPAGIRHGLKWRRRRLMQRLRARR
jgi:FkbM family methyltransferase